EHHGDDAREDHRTDRTDDSRAKEEARELARVGVLRDDELGDDRSIGEKERAMLVDPRVPLLARRLVDRSREREQEREARRIPIVASLRELETETRRRFVGSLDEDDHVIDVEVG